MAVMGIAVVGLSPRPDRPSGTRSCPHLFEELGIPAGTKGTLPRSGPLSM